MKSQFWSGERNAEKELIQEELKKQEDEDTGLTIKLLSYIKPNEKTEIFYISEITTLEITTLFPSDRKILSSKIFAYDFYNDILEEETINRLKTIQQFNDFFTLNSDYYIHDCDLNLDNGTKISSHDDGEVSIEIASGSEDYSIIPEIFRQNNLDIELISILKNNPEHYIAIDDQGNVIGNFENFDEYLKFGRF